MCKYKNIEIHNNISSLLIIFFSNKIMFYISIVLFQYTFITVNKVIWFFVRMAKVFITNKIIEDLCSNYINDSSNAIGFHWNYIYIYLDR